MNIDKSKTKGKDTTPTNQVKITCNLDKDLWQRLDNLAQKTGRVKSFYIRQAVARHLSELEEQGENHLATDFAVKKQQ